MQENDCNIHLIYMQKNRPKVHKMGGSKAGSPLMAKSGPTLTLILYSLMNCHLYIYLFVLTLFLLN